MRTFVFGDIHGGFLALKQLIEKINPTKFDQLIFLGDYVDGWSQPVEVINALLELEQAFNCIFIKGNHDELLETWLNGGKHNEKWLKHGGRITKQCYLNESEATRQKHLAFLQSLPYYHIDNKNRLFIHGGFTSHHGVTGEYHQSYISWDRTLWELALALNPLLTKEDQVYPKRLKLYPEIYIGHTPTTNYGISLPMNKANVWNVDTGAAFKGSISSINIDTKEVFQSDPVYQFYPEEKGRN